MVPAQYQKTYPNTRVVVWQLEAGNEVGATIKLPKKIEYDARGLGSIGGLFEMILLAVRTINSLFGRDHGRS